MPWERPTLKQLNERIAADFSGRLLDGGKILTRSVLAVLAKVWSGGVNTLHLFLEYCFSQVFADTAEAEYLARLCNIWGISRNAASKAAGSAVFSASAGSVIPAGWRIQYAATGAEYEVLEDAEPDSGVITVQIEASEAGAGGNIAAGEAVSLVSPRAGVVSGGTVGSAGITGGFDEEGDASLRARLLSRLRTPPRGGSKADYVAWALEVSGVTRAWCFPLGVGLGTVSLTFVTEGADDLIPTEEMRARVQAHIDANNPAPVEEAEVFIPTRMPVDFTVSVTPDTAAVRQAVTGELADLIAVESTAEGFTLLRSHITQAISLAAGEEDHELISPPGNVDVPQGYFPVLGVVTFVPAGEGA